MIEAVGLPLTEAETLTLVVMDGEAVDQDETDVLTESVLDTVGERETDPEGVGECECDLVATRELVATTVCDESTDTVTIAEDEPSFDGLIVTDTVKKLGEAEAEVLPVEVSCACA